MLGVLQPQLLPGDGHQLLRLGVEAVQEVGIEEFAGEVDEKLLDVDEAIGRREVTDDQAFIV